MRYTVIILIALIQCGANSDAVVIVRHDNKSCSGVCVSPEGLILTAEHCDLGNGSRVSFQQHGTYIATKVYAPKINGIDEVVALQVESDEPLPYLPVAQSPIKIGNPIYTMGYPSGNFARIEGNIISSSLTFTVTNFRLVEGHSGGPLLNFNNEVVGIASGRSLTPLEASRLSIVANTQPFSIFIAWKSIQNALNAPKRKTLVCFSQSDYAPCNKFKSDVKGGLFSEYNVIVCQQEGSIWIREDLIDEFAEVTSPDIKLEYPTFWLRGGSKYTTGYVDSNELLNWISDKKVEIKKTEIKKTETNETEKLSQIMLAAMIEIKNAKLIAIKAKNDAITALVIQVISIIIFYVFCFLPLIKERR